MDQDTAGRLVDLEKRLLDPQVRRSREGVGALLAGCFVEIGSSGRIFTRNEIIDELANEEPQHIEASDFIPTELSASVIRITYRTANSRRESIWLETDDGWKIVFHRGTRLV